MLIWRSVWGSIIFWLNISPSPTYSNLIFITQLSAHAKSSKRSLSPSSKGSSSAKRAKIADKEPPVNTNEGALKACEGIAQAMDDTVELAWHAMQVTQTEAAKETYKAAMNAQEMMREHLKSLRAESIESMMAAKKGE